MRNVFTFICVLNNACVWDNLEKLSPTILFYFSVLSNAVQCSDVNYALHPCKTLFSFFISFEFLFIAMQSVRARKRAFV